MARGDGVSVFYLWRRSSVAGTLKKARTRGKTDQRGLKRLFKSFISESVMASEKLGNAVMEPGTLRAWLLPMGSFPGKRGRGNVLLAGDAGSFVDPLTGEGIYYALKSVQFAAEASAKALTDGTKHDLVVCMRSCGARDFSFMISPSGMLFRA